MKTVSARSERIPSLDGLRALSIAMVLLAHLAGTQSFPLPASAGRLLGLGELGVHVFFVISGFLITGLLMDELKSSGHISLGNFYFRRTLRIFPAYYVFVAAIWLAGRAGWLQLAPHDVVHAVTYTSNYYPARSWSFGHTWSLSVEEQFYLLWPARPGARWPAARARGGRVRGAPCSGHSPRVVGADAVGRRRDRAPVRDGGGRDRRRLRAGGMPVVAARVGVLQTSARVPLVCSRAAHRLSRQSSPRPPGGVLLRRTHRRQRRGSPWCSIAASRSRTVPSAACSTRRPWCSSGRLSYSLYLWQQVFLNRDASSAVSTFPANLALAVCAALASYYIVERPALTLRRWLEKRAPTVRTVVVDAPVSGAYERGVS